jgi:hypothetical protein
MVNAIIALAKRDVIGEPYPPYTPTWAMIKHTPRQQTAMHTGFIQILNSMYLGMGNKITCNSFYLNSQFDISN